MLSYLKRRQVVMLTSALLVSLSATGAMSRRMRMAAEQAIAAPATSSNSVNTNASAPLAHHLNPALTKTRQCVGVGRPEASRSVACIEQPPLRSDLNAGDFLQLRACGESLAGQNSLQTWSVRWQV